MDGKSETFNTPINATKVVSRFLSSSGKDKTGISVKGEVSKYFTKQEKIHSLNLYHI